MKMSKLIIFDFDGTIADSMWAWDELGKITLQEDGLPALPDYENIIRTMSVPDFAVYLAERYPSLGSSESLMKKWHEKMIFNYLNRIELKKGIKEFLEYLKNAGYTVYLASATLYAVLMKALEHFNLTEYFDYILTEEIVGISKRDPKIYKLCMEKAGVSPENTIVFEDAVHAVQTIKKLGVKVCAVSDYSMRAHVGEIREICDLYVDDFTDITKLKKFIG